MAPMGIRLSPLGVAIFCLLGVGVIYHLYAGVISNRVAAFRSVVGISTLKHYIVTVSGDSGVSLGALGCSNQCASLLCYK